MNKPINALRAWRIQTTEADVRFAAARAARAASQHQHLTSANTAAHATAVAVLADRDVTCRNLRVTTSGDLAPGGVVTVTVTCTADLSDLALLAVPGTHTATATVAEAVDRYRGGTP